MPTFSRSGRGYCQSPSAGACSAGGPSATSRGASSAVYSWGPFGSPAFLASCRCFVADRRESPELTAEPRRTVLFDVLDSDGAEFVEWEGWLWADHFGDPQGEHHAVRQDVGIWDLSPLRKWEFRGPDAANAADNIFTQDICALGSGQLCYSP